MHKLFYALRAAKASASVIYGALIRMFIGISYDKKNEAHTSDGSKHSFCVHHPHFLRSFVHTYADRMLRNDGRARSL